MSKIALGQFVNTNSIIHKIDARIKIIGTILLMITIFIIPTNNFYLLGLLLLFALILVFLTKVQLSKFMRSLKSILFLLVFAFVFQVFFRNEGTILYTHYFKFTWTNIAIALLISVLYILFRKRLPFKFICFLLITTLVIYILGIPMYGNLLNSKEIKLNIYAEGLISGSFIILRVLTLIVFSTILTLTTKPTELNNAIESLLSPLELLHIKTSVFAMMVSIALRFIPTLFLEADKILKAQASRGVDFNEGNLKSKISQIISLLVPMFVVSFKKADELAIAMEARGYIPGEKRTKINEMKLRVSDYIWLGLYLLIFISYILIRVL